MQGTPYVMQRETWLSSKRSPCTAPPFGNLTAISLKDGRTLWTCRWARTKGSTRSACRSCRPTADGELGGAITTVSGLVFIGFDLDAHVRAFDVETGRELWNTSCRGGKATPMTYLGADGRQ
jgi:quinoprotein glucose dehydrogenase